jgi:hypothetical protein
MQGYVDTRAPKGAIGTLLLDPTNIYIATNQASATTAGMSGTDTSASTGPFTFEASGAVSDSLLTVATLQGILTTSSVTVSTANTSGTGAGTITVVDPISWSSDTPLTLSAASDIFINAAINGGNGSALNLISAGGNITQIGTIAVWSLSARADAGSITLTNASNNVRTLAGYAGSGGFSFVNSQALAIESAGGENGITTLGNGAINIRSTGALTVSSAVTSTTGNITLEAGATGSNGDILTINSGSVVSTGGAVLLKAGAAITDQGTVTGSPVTQQANLNSPLPTLSQCMATPTLDGCSSVLPSLAQCTASPILAGCSVVMPTLSQCTATPSLVGCGVVLPSLAQCSVTPTLAGCSAVLPSLSACTTTPTLAGCSVVLPTTQTAANQPVTQAINSTINIINTSTTTSTTPIVTLTALTTNSNKADAGKDDKTSETKKDDTKKDDTKDTLVSDKTGVKNDSPAKKLYCN